MFYHSTVVLALIAFSPSTVMADVTQCKDSVAQCFTSSNCTMDTPITDTLGCYSGCFSDNKNVSAACNTTESLGALNTYAHCMSTCYQTIMSGNNTANSTATSTSPVIPTAIPTELPTLTDEQKKTMGQCCDQCKSNFGNATRDDNPKSRPSSADPMSVIPGALLSLCVLAFGVVLL